MSKFNHEIIPAIRKPTKITNPPPSLFSGPSKFNRNQLEIQTIEATALKSCHLTSIIIKNRSSQPRFSHPLPQNYFIDLSPQFPCNVFSYDGNYKVIIDLSDDVFVHPSFFDFVLMTFSGYLLNLG